MTDISIPRRPHPTVIEMGITFRGMSSAMIAVARMGVAREAEARARIVCRDLAGAEGSFHAADRLFRAALDHIPADPPHVARLVRRAP